MNHCFLMMVIIFTGIIELIFALYETVMGENAK